MLNSLDSDSDLSMYLVPTTIVIIVEETSEVLKLTYIK